MNKKNKLIIFQRLTFWGLLLINSFGYAAPDKVQLVVWAQEAIIATYTFNYKTFVADQKAIAKYYSSAGWINYSDALIKSKLPEAVQKNNYDVNAVATQPAVLTNLDANHWQVTMPILVVYKNPQYQQQQNLDITLKFATAPDGQGVRGFTVNSLQAVAAKPPCQCPNVENAIATKP